MEQNILKEMLLKPEFWDATYNKMIQKQGISQDDKDKIWKIKEIYKYDIVDEKLNELTRVFQKKKKNNYKNIKRKE